MPHPLIEAQDEIDRLAVRLTQSERTVLRALARRGDWRTGAECYPKVANLAAATHLSRRTVQTALRSLTCPSPVRTLSGLRPCLLCGHRELLVVTRPATRYSPTTYAIVLGAWSQERLPERSEWTAPGVQSTTARGATHDLRGAKHDRSAAVRGAEIAPYPDPDSGDPEDRSGDHQELRFIEAGPAEATAEWKRRIREDGPVAARRWAADHGFAV